MTTTRLLIVDDERNIRLTLAATLASPDVEIFEAGDGDGAVRQCAERTFDVVLLDLRLPGLDGLTVLRRIRELRPDASVIVVTAHGSIDAAVEAMKAGAFDFLQKPFAPEEIRGVVARALRREPPAAAGEDPCAEARAHLRALRVDAAADAARRALSSVEHRADALHILGAVADLQGDRLRAQSHYRAALALQPRHAAARHNLERSVTGAGGALRLGGIEEASS